MKQSLFIALFLLIPTILFSQNSNDKTIYLDSLRKETTEGNHKYYRIIKDSNLEKDNYKIYEYYKSGALQMEGTSATNAGWTREGEFICYYENGNKKSISNYIKSRLNGKQYDWYENGNKKLEGEYIVDDLTITEKLKILQYWDNNNNQTVINGNGFCESDNGYFSDKGEIKNGYRNNTWTGISHKNDYTYSEKYQDGKFISGVGIDSDGTRHEYLSMEVKPIPKNGLQHFYKYVGKNFRFSKEATKNNIKGKVIVQFVVDKNGEITEPKILKSLGYGLDEEAIRVILRYKNWIPGEQRGRKVRVLYSLPIILDHQ